MLGFVPLVPDPIKPIPIKVYYDYSNAISPILGAFIPALIYAVAALIVAHFLKIDKKARTAIIVTNILVVYPFFTLPLVFEKWAGVIQWLSLILIPLIEGYIYDKVLVTQKKVGFKLAFLSSALLLLVLIGLCVIPNIRYMF